MDMLHGPLAGKLLQFTLPIALSSIVQQLFNAADTAVAGYFGSADSLAAVGTNTEIIALIVTVSSGLAVGANILAANLIGRNEKNGLPSTVQARSVAVHGTVGSLQLRPYFCGRAVQRVFCRPLYDGRRRDRKRLRAHTLYPAVRACMQFL